MRFFLLVIIISIYANAETICKTKLQKYFMLKVYEITLCKEEHLDYNSIFQTSFSIVLKYKMSSSSHWIGNRSLSEICKNYQLTEEERKAYKKHFNGFFPSVQNGDEIKMEFSPKYGAEFYFNGKFFGKIEDITFATRTANIWLHPNSTFKGTRDFLFANE